MRRVAVLTLEGVVPFDLGVPCGVFGHVQVPGMGRGYRVQVCGATQEIRTNEFALTVTAGLEALRDADLIVVPGLGEAGLALPPPEQVLKALKQAARSGCRIASICTGAFVLAAAGLLDHGPATTHWRAASALAQRYPRVQVDANVLYVQRGNLFTSAGAAAGLDLCVHLVRLDYGAAVAAEAARCAVMPPERSGAQTQIIVHPAPSEDGTSLAPVLEWLERHLAEPLTLGAIAQRAGLSARTLNRRFRAQTGTSPLQWLLRARIRHAQTLLETTSHPVELIAHAAGFGSGTSLRDHFQRVIETTPQAYRRAFRGAAAS